MLPFKRPDEPTYLKENWQKWGDPYATRRTIDAGARFQWPQLDHEKINKPLSELLSSPLRNIAPIATLIPLESGRIRSTISVQNRFLIAPSGVQMGKPYFSCPNCQGFKKEKWSDAPRLIAPDEEGYSFERFFIIDFSTWQIEPNPKASEFDQQRATYTITTLGLRDSKHVKGRKSNWELYDLKSRVGEPYVIDDFAYRYMLA